MSRLGHGTLGALVGAALGILMLGPALLPGYTLHYDLVFVPDLPLSARTLGTDGAVPRAMPNDLVVALLGLVLPGWLVQKAVLLGSLVVAGAGAARLASTRWGAVTAAVLFVWNAWVGERIGIGHWGYLMGYAMLPWVLAAAARLVQEASPEERSRARWLLLGTLTVAALGGSTAAVLATGLAVITLAVARASWRRRIAEAALVVGVSAVVNASWWWPFLTAGSRAADPAGVATFAARADTPFGILGSGLLGGALWNQQTWFAERETVIGAGVALVATVLVLGLALGRRDWWGDVRQRAAAAAGGAGLLLAVAATTSPGAKGVTWLVETVPGAGLLRDSQKFLALTVLLLAAAAAAVVDRVSRSGAGVPLLVSLAVWPVATLPTLAAGNLGAWGSVAYPAEYTETAEAVDSAEGDGSLLALPWMTYRSYPWNEHRVVLDPWNRLVSRDVLSSDDLPVGGRVVSGEDPRAAEVVALLAAGPDPVVATERLRALGVRYVVLDSSQPSPEGTVLALEADVVREAGELRLLDLGPAAALGERHAPTGLVLAVVGMTAVVLGLGRTGLAGLVARRATRR